MINRSRLYDQIYDKADKLFKEYNPCKIRCKNGETRCVAMGGKGRSNNKLCCNYCIGHWSEEGCTIKCLKCKLYLCHLPRPSTEHKQIRIELRKLQRIASKYMLALNYFITKKQAIEDMLSNLEEST